MGSDDISEGLDDTMLRPAAKAPEPKVETGATERVAGPDDAPTTPVDPFIGLLIEDRYEIRRLLARGGMGAVYVAHDLRFETEVAIKFLQTPQGHDQADLERRFEGEAKVLAQLRDPRILRPLSWGRSSNGDLFLVSELLEGQPLDAALRNEPRMAVPRLLRVLIDTCRGLSEAHGAGVVHRDLKPANLFLQRSRGGEETTRILDFGVAKITQESQLISSDTSPQTTPGLVVGTVPYMSPEQVRGQPVGAESDIYSLGVVAYRALTGVLPFSGEPHTVMLAHISETPRRFADVAADLDVPSTLEDLVMQMLAKAPEARPRSASELGRTLERILATTDPQALVTSSVPPTALARPVAVDDATAASPPPPTARASWPRWAVGFAVTFALAWVGLEFSRSDAPEPTAEAAEAAAPAAAVPDTAEAKPSAAPTDEAPAAAAVAPAPAAARAVEPARSRDETAAPAAAETPRARRAPTRRTPAEAKPSESAARTPKVSVRSEVGLTASAENQRALDRLAAVVGRCVRPGDREVGLVILGGGRRTLKVRRQDGGDTKGTEACVGRSLDQLAFDLAGDMGMVTLEVQP